MTDTKFPAQFAGNLLSVSGFAPRETLTPGRVPQKPLSTRCHYLGAGGRLCEHKRVANPGLTWTDTEFPAQFAGNWLSVPGFAPRDPQKPLSTRCHYLGAACRLANISESQTRD